MTSAVRQIYRVPLLLGLLAGTTALFSLSTPLESKSTPAAPARQVDLIFVQAPKLATGTFTGRFPDGSRIVRLKRASNPKAPEVLTADFLAAADPQVDFTGTHILFSAKKDAATRWQIWEMAADGSGKRQLSHCEDDCLRGEYLPGEEIVYTEVKSAEGRERSQLQVARLDGTNAHAITFGPGNWWLETVLRDGRVVASAAWPLQETKTPSAARTLYTLRPDGTGLDSLRCDNEGTGRRSDAAERADGSILFIESAARQTAPGGQLTEVARGAVKEREVGLKSVRTLSPRAMPDGTIVLAKARTNASGRETFDLVEMKTTATSGATFVYAGEALSSIQPVALAPHERPKKFWSLVDLESKAGYLIALDAYSTQDAAGQRIAVPIAKVRVHTAAESAGGSRLLGEAPVEADGSFFVEVPANLPVRFELLDAQGNVLLAERGWIWARPGEQRGCAGCHADKSLAPQNRWPMTLKRFDTPTKLGERPNGSTATAK